MGPNTRKPFDPVFGGPCFLKTFFEREDRLNSGKEPGIPCGAGGVVGDLSDLKRSRSDVLFYFDSSSILGMYLS